MDGVVDLGGLRVAYRRTGAGPPLLLLHGGMSDSREWRHQLADLADAFTVVAWDAPGCGSSDDPPESWRLPEFADCAVALCRALQLDRLHVAGLSFGGGLALEVYRRHAGMVRSLSLLSSYAGWKGSLPPEEVETRLTACLSAARHPVDPTPAEVAVFLGPAPSAALVAELVALGSGTRPAAYRVMGHAFAEADLRELLPRITVPTLVVHGDADRRCPLQVGRALHAAIPSAVLVVLPGIGHQCNLEAPALVNAALQSFLQRR
ncbi:MAG: alpha/beta hydrolase [Actinobacteria bacterium]|nr:alpha/beta hydrolase [Actinomycetota bacterium]MCA1722064.1 alpha/beta hydrolase [Actinomycetota bacterium]